MRTIRTSFLAATSLLLLKGTGLCSTPEPQASKKLPTSATQNAHFLWGIDHLSKCTHLERKSGILRIDGYRERGDDEYDVFLLMSADGRTEEYKFEFGKDDRYPFAFRPANHSHKSAGPDTVKNPADRKLCRDVVRRLDRWIPRWPHYESPMIQKDNDRGFRVSFYTVPKKGSDARFQCHDNAHGSVH